MDKRDYYEQLQDNRWKQRRRDILLLDNYACRRCGSKEGTLNVHHVRYISGRKAWEYDDKDLITLCERCHHEVHNDAKKRDIGVEEGQVYEYHYSDYTCFLLCCHIDYVKEEILLMGIDNGGSYDTLTVFVEGFQFFDSNYTIDREFFGYNIEPGGLDACLLKSLYYFCEKGKENADFGFKCDHDEVRRWVSKAIDSNTVLCDLYTTLCNDENFLMSL